MNRLYKKLIIVFSSITFIPALTLSVVSCVDNSWKDLYRPDPIMPIVKTGFENANIDSIDIEKIYYTDDLISQIEESLIKGGYNNTTFSVEKNGSSIKMTDDLYRNATYKFVVKNNDNETDNITATIKITNSLHLQDVFRVTNIGTVIDQRPRTIMMALMFYNLDMLNELSRVGDELTDSTKFTYKEDNSGALINIDDQIPEIRPTNYYGSLDLSYKIEPFNQGDLQFPMTIAEMVEKSTENEVKTEFGKVDGIDKFTILMHFIMENVTSPTFWPLFVNDLDLYGDGKFEAIPVSGVANKYKMKFEVKEFKEGMLLPETPEEQNGEYDNYAHYLKDEEGIEVTFSYFG
ncbi:hypothetical protein [Spiroplasma diminutum]|uniref:Lipoprotein n=1 Tax=Spiroplasma diminutum CUAS-1 TaxID=1276221 RepID=S5MF75_9MOLU|nr:hypothetical protein [Spiroplasma diminutum]AGR42448.1 hypothetical protein SDIMI_v3c07440 [Spiroplasma diminutum CUAS-1]